MSVVNITVDQNEDVTIEIADASAAVDDKILFQFFHNLANQLNLATTNFGGVSGDVVITPGVKYSFHITALYAQKLDIANITYKIFRLSVNNNLPSWEVLQNGNVTVTQLIGAPAPPPEYAGMDTPRELIGTEVVVDCLLSNNFYVDNLPLDAVYTFRNFFDGATKQVKITNINSDTLNFSSNDAVIKWLTVDNLQPAHPENKTILYSFMRWGDQILATASDPF